MELFSSDSKDSSPFLLSLDTLSSTCDPSSPQKGKYEHNRRSRLGGFYGPVLKVTDFGEGGVKWSLEFSAQLARKGKQVDRAHSFATTKL